MGRARARTIMERKWTAALASGGRGFTFALDGRLEAGRHWVPQPRPTDRPALFQGSSFVAADLGEHEQQYLTYMRRSGHHPPL